MGHQVARIGAARPGAGQPAAAVGRPDDRQARVRQLQGKTLAGPVQPHLQRLRIEHRDRVATRIEGQERRRLATQSAEGGRPSPRRDHRGRVSPVAVPETRILAEVQDPAAALIQRIPAHGQPGLRHAVAIDADQWLVERGEDVPLGLAGRQRCIPGPDRARKPHRQFG